MIDNGLWDEELIRAIFLPIDACAILRIPVRPQEDDWWAWEPEKHGEYTVKSAYRKMTTPRFPKQMPRVMNPVHEFGNYKSLRK
jgi:hypothetical protein